MAKSACSQSTRARLLPNRGRAAARCAARPPRKPLRDLCAPCAQAPMRPARALRALCALSALRGLRAPRAVHALRALLALRAMLHDLRITRYRQIAPDHLSAARAMRSLPSQRAPQAALRRLIERPTSPRPSSRAVVGSGTATMPAASRNALSMPVGRSHTFREPSAL